MYTVTLDNDTLEIRLKGPTNTWGISATFADITVPYRHVINRNTLYEILRLMSIRMKEQELSLAKMNEIEDTVLTITKGINSHVS